MTAALILSTGISYDFTVDEINISGLVVSSLNFSAQCPAGYSRFGTSCFKYETTGVTWDEAVIRCARENATLASIRNAKEEKFVRDLQRKAGSTVETWIGMEYFFHISFLKLRFYNSKFNS